MRSNKFNYDLKGKLYSFSLNVVKILQDTTINNSHLKVLLKPNNLKIQSPNKAKAQVKSKYVNQKTPSV